MFYVDYVSALADVVVAVAPCIAVWIAWSGIDQWQRETLGKRKTELAEEVLADFYQARDIINGARFPSGFEGEGLSRKRRDGETEAESKLLDSYYIVVERLDNQRSFFSQLFSRKYRVSAIFGKKTEELYAELNSIYGDISRAVHSGFAFWQESYARRAVIWREGNFELGSVEALKRGRGSHCALMTGCVLCVLLLFSFLCGIGFSLFRRRRRGGHCLRFCVISGGDASGGKAQDARARAHNTKTGALKEVILSSG
ncbi:MAG: hypothetical protein EOM37_06325 [Proteobacteria bacterium]|jgi:hypothetical protein|nr:hypothetical protein [Alphaproteobacteria bacterium]NCC03646.1 hypothetical protein [Pseudomonadota bacterium]